MKLSELDGLVSAAQSAEEEQNNYVLSLGAKITAGETNIRVYTDDVWTTVDLTAFWTIQHDKYLAMAAYSTLLLQLRDKLQGELDEALKTVVVPASNQPALEDVE